MPQEILHCGVPYGILKRFQMLPMHLAASAHTLHIVFAEEIAYRALVAVEQMLDCKTEVCLSTPAALQAGFERMQHHTAPSEKQSSAGRGPGEMTSITSSYVARLDAENVKLAGYGELAWVRIEGDNDCMSLLFQRRQ